MTDMYTNFFMSSFEYKTLSDIRECSVIDEIKGTNQKSYWLIKVSPSMPFEESNINDISEIIVTERHKGDSLQNLQENETISLYAFKMLSKSFLKSRLFSENDIELAGWVDVSRNKNVLIETRKKIFGL